MLYYSEIEKKMIKKKKVLFLCKGNSCRSQMAEGWTRHLWNESIEPYSAGIEKHGLNPYTIKVMAEAGVDISHQYSKIIDELPCRDFDLVVTVCDNTLERCPLFPVKTKIIHVGFEDPPYLAQFVETEKEKLNIYRRVRDEIKEFANEINRYF